MMDKPTGKKGSYSHPSSPTLDSANDTTRAMTGKGITSARCFVFDHFPRRVTTSSPPKMHVRDICPEWNQVLDDLHSEYRKLGGKVTLILGQQAFKAYLSVAEKENVFQQSLTDNSPCGYTVLVERATVISRAGICLN